jgi:hypothetical protein
VLSFLFFWPLCYLPFSFGHFVIKKGRKHRGQKKKEDNTGAKRKRKIIQWPKEKGR